MTRCFSLTGSINWLYQISFSFSGLRPTVTDIGDGTVMHCWVPNNRNPNKPNILLIHGFGANAIWQFDINTLRLFLPYFNIYVPDLLFFGGSHTIRPERSESFQARCVMRLMEVIIGSSVEGLRVVGMSYGGFVAYSLAAQFPASVERVVICCAGVCLEEDDLTNGLMKVSDLELAADILVPQTPEKMRELISYTLVKKPICLPSCLLWDFIQEMFKDRVEEKKDLLRAVAKDRKLSNLPKINQPTLILWGDQDQVFPVELAYRLKRHLGDNAQLEIIKNTGHAFSMEKPKEFYRHLRSFLIHQ
ncbi:monoacylglycerol lipase ABHD6-like [Impatiens glandulifera]|uniref:monoacylglycerol lipase ABHD6-like n=1 Tax=Impatiens glandulifera TaxID=253017 RepID=UPI001FB09369|nr:monoacylglycerol lipase ABHD6-like [Impatiens glandulifera]